MRTFIAIELPEEVKENICNLRDRLRKTDVRVSWITPEKMHLTLRFLGEISEEQVDKIVTLLVDNYKGINPFSLKVKGTGAFPSLRKPNVIWAGIKEFEEGLTRCHAIAENSAIAIGLKREKRHFNPHLTIARIRDLRNVGKLINLVKKEKDFDGGAFSVDSVALFSSKLTRKGPIYTRLKEFFF